MQYTHRSQKLIFLHLFTDLYCKDFSSLLRIIFAVTVAQYIWKHKVTFLASKSINAQEIIARTYDQMLFGLSPSAVVHVYKGQAKLGIPHRLRLPNCNGYLVQLDQ